MIETCSIRTGKRSEMKDITSRIREIVKQSGIAEGLAVIHCPHTTAGITVNEGADPDVVKDIVMELDKTFPWDDQDYRHREGNSAAHLKSSFLGVSATIPISGGKLLLGTWQSIYFCEFDGPRSRTFHVKVLEG
jgi:secondary thiamine-phosphate synthase enzyme